MTFLEHIAECGIAVRCCTVTVPLSTMGTCVSIGSACSFKHNVCASSLQVCRQNHRRTAAVMLKSEVTYFSSGRCGVATHHDVISMQQLAVFHSTYSFICTRSVSVIAATTVTSFFIPTIQIGSASGKTNVEYQTCQETKRRRF